VFLINIDWWFKCFSLSGFGGCILWNSCSRTLLFTLERCCFCFFDMWFFNVFIFLIYYLLFMWFKTFSFVTWGCVCRWEQNSRRKVCYWWLHNVDGLPYASSTSSWIFASLWLCNLWRTLCKKVDECLYFLIYFCSLYSVCFAIELGWEMWYS